MKKVISVPLLVYTLILLLITINQSFGVDVENDSGTTQTDIIVESSTPDSFADACQSKQQPVPSSRIESNDEIQNGTTKISLFEIIGLILSGVTVVGVILIPTLVWLSNKKQTNKIAEDNRTHEKKLQKIFIDHQEAKERSEAEYQGKLNLYLAYQLGQYLSEWWVDLRMKKINKRLSNICQATADQLQVGIVLTDLINVNTSARFPELPPDVIRVRLQNRHGPIVEAAYGLGAILAHIQISKCTNYQTDEVKRIFNDYLADFEKFSKRLNLDLPSEIPKSSDLCDDEDYQYYKTVLQFSEDCLKKFRDKFVHPALKCS